MAEPYTATAYRDEELCGAEATVESVEHLNEVRLLLTIRRLQRERDDLAVKINTPHTADFLGAVRLEAVHQRERWIDVRKLPADWFWLIGYLAGKALHAAVLGDTDKALHHTISTAAVLLNWHAHLTDQRERDVRQGGAAS